jgi:hypothetical protein
MTPLNIALTLNRGIGIATRSVGEKLSVLMISVSFVWIEKIR